ncbi:hypothetical protein ABKA04_009533 [Annulohypoxylon sp. FPYF3050]
MQRGYNLQMSAEIMDSILDKFSGAKGTRKLKKSPTQYTDPKKLLEYIKTGEQIRFRDAPKRINNEDLLMLAEAIAARYRDDEIPHEDTNGKKDNEEEGEMSFPTPPCSPSQQTLQQWLDLLLDASSPDPRARRNLAEELIKKIGKTENYAQDQNNNQTLINQVGILWHVIDNTDDLCYDKDNRNQTLFHVAAINGAKWGIKVCIRATKDGDSPLSYAIIEGKKLVIKTILDLLGKSKSEDIRKLLKKAIGSRSGNNIEIIQDLLTSRTAGAEERYRTDVLTQDILQLAAKHFNFEVFEFLLNVGNELLKNESCNLIHYVVYIGQAGAAKYLLQKYPELVTKLHTHPDHAIPQTIVQWPNSSREVDEEKFPVLALYRGEDMELRDLIFETLMERLPISQLREHLGDIHVGLSAILWTGKEISLDITILAFDSLSLTSFLSFVCSELENCVKQKSILSSNEAGEGSPQTARPKNIPADKLLTISNGGIEFERILKYVHIPYFVGLPGKKRDEAISILKWLKLCKGVRRVFEVSVNDCRHCPSTEEDIETALQGLKVQHLDWKRTDLSITSIAKVAKDLKTLYLYSSGNLGAIDHWLGSNGINTLNEEILASKIKVAVLDSGVNGTRFPLEKHDRHGRSFVWNEHGKGQESEASWWLAVDPHGSQMANIISQLDPFCVFYFFQIANNMNYISTPTVVKALEWAIKCDVDIINCSFALDEDQAELEAVLRKAKQKDIIIMCSTADEGENVDEVWPAAYYRRERDRAETFDNIFPIVGCNEHGKFSKYANESAGRYMFRGEDVDVSSADLTLPMETDNVHGSSVATAIATGVASLILACYQLVKKELDKKSSRSGLVDACFHKMCEPLKNTNTSTGTKYLVKANKLFAIDEDGFGDSLEFIEYLQTLFNEIS